MNSEWPSVRLGEHAELLTGFPFKSADYVATDHAVRLLRGDNIGQGRLRWEDAKRWPVERCDGLRDYLLQEGDVVLAMDRPWIPAGLKFAKVRAGDHPALLVQRVARLRPKLGLTANFLHYVVASHDFTQYIQNVTTGTAVPHISASQIREYKFKLPDILTQTTCGELLMALDDRIALLRETNATLEAIAQALFKSWFVDFDPVRAKQQGLAPAGMDEATVALFPDSFEDSAFGLVPKGWHVESIYEVAQVIYGAPFASSKFNTEGVGTPLARIRDLRDESPGVFTPEVHPKGYLIQPGDIVVGMDGEFRAYLWGGEQAWLNQRVCVFAPRANTPAAFVHLAIAPLLASIEASETATTVIHLGKNDIDRFRVLLPEPSVLGAFARISSDLYSRIVSMKQSARTLATLRDTLLPRLISGQLRLPQAGIELAKVTA